VTPGGAILIGLAAGGLCYSATLLRERLKIDDALDVFAVHGVGGVFGAVATGVLATSVIQPSFRGLIDGNPGQVVTQIVAIGATIAYAVIATFVIVKVVNAILGIRISAHDEELGLDLSTHGEVAYQL
jgi:ammonium transporter, Amt family